MSSTLGPDGKCVVCGRKYSKSFCTGQCERRQAIGWTAATRHLYIEARLEMSVEAFVEAVLARIDIKDPRDIPAMTGGTASLYHQGFSIADAVKFSNCMEEVNPELGEEEALKRMEAIRARYRAGE